MPHPTQLLLVRHGQTTANVAKILDTRPPGAPLTQLGVNQARALGAWLPTQPREISVVASSQALRARQTVGHLATALDTEAREITGTYEVFAGDFEGQATEHAHTIFHTAFWHWLHGRLDSRIPGGESGQDVLDRYLPNLSGLWADHHTGGDVVLVSHGAAIRLVAGFLTGVDGEFAFHNSLPNTALISLTPRVRTASAEALMQPGSWQLEAWAQADHIDQITTSGG